MKIQLRLPTILVIAWMAPRQVSSENLRSRGSHVCPVQMPEVAGGYYEKLHALLVQGNGHLQGCRDGSAQEYFVTAFKDEIQCLYAMVLRNHCNGLPSKHESRQEKWELNCLDPNKSLLAAYNLMDDNEKDLFNKLKGEASERQIYKTYLQLAGYKELVCMMMKTVDDECMNFGSPRLLPPSYWRK